MRPYLEPTVEFFDHASVPPAIQELLDEWPEIDPSTAQLVRAAIMSREPRRLRQAWEMLNARAELAQAMQLDGSPRYCRISARRRPDCAFAVGASLVREMRRHEKAARRVTYRAASSHGTTGTN